MAKAKKFHVHCRLDNASNEINGIAFAAHEDGGVRTVEPVEAAVAAQFKDIPGYSIVPAVAGSPASQAPAELLAPQTPDASGSEDETPDAPESPESPKQADLLPQN